MLADRAYDHDKYRKQVRAVGVTPVIARRGTEHGSGLGQYRWVVEQTFALLHWFRRLRIRWEIRDDIHEAFLRLACAIICLRRLTSLSPCALRVLSRRVRRMTPKRRKRRGESVPSPEQDKAEVVRAVLTRREIGVVTSAAAETARDHRHATLLLWPGGRNPTATHFHSAGGSRCGTHPWRRHRQRGIR